MQDLPSNLQEYFVFDYDGKLGQHKQTTSKPDDIYKLSRQLLIYVNFVSNMTDGTAQWLVTLDPKRIIVMKKNFEQPPKWIKTQ